MADKLFSLAGKVAQQALDAPAEVAKAASASGWIIAHRRLVKIAAISALVLLVLCSVASLASSVWMVVSHVA